MNDSHIISIAQVKEFLKVAKNIEFQTSSRQEKYSWIGNVLLRFRYFSLRKKEKSILKKYLVKMTGYSDAQLGQLIAKKKKYGVIAAGKRARHRFHRI
jgi:hypothetical protein